MKKTYPTGRKIAGSGDSRAVHLRKAGKRRANKGTRKALRVGVPYRVVIDGGI